MLKVYRLTFMLLLSPINAGHLVPVTTQATAQPSAWVACSQQSGVLLISLDGGIKQLSGYAGDQYVPAWRGFAVTEENSSGGLVSWDPRTGKLTPRGTTSNGDCGYISRTGACSADLDYLEFTLHVVRITDGLPVASFTRTELRRMTGLKLANPGFIDDRDEGALWSPNDDAVICALPADRMVTHDGLHQPLAYQIPLQGGRPKFLGLGVPVAWLPGGCLLTRSPHYGTPYGEDASIYNAKGRLLRKRLFFDFAYDGREIVAFPLENSLGRRRIELWDPLLRKKEGEAMLGKHDSQLLTFPIVGAFLF